MYISYCQDTGIKLQKSEAGHDIVTVRRMFLSIFLVFFLVFFSWFFFMVKHAILVVFVKLYLKYKYLSEINQLNNFFVTWR